MARQTDVVLLLLLATAATALSAEVMPLPDAYFDKIIQEAEQRQVNDRCSKCCPLGWVPYNGRCLIYQAAKMIWTSAEKQCQDLGGHLLSVHSENEYRMAKNLIRTHDSAESPTWIGLSSCQQKDKWFWSDGTKLIYTKWNPREPNRLFGECCVHVNYGKQKDWNDSSCKKKYPFVCAKKLY
ncbi:hypothetical protein AMELA_G00059410 [Ameiurus melas]|uniref:C-type lectin domain-containing protein n=1 Tax=Ameiurus melas TaxID=219545 RepID=A0A7J6B1S3_AMEME|nr:hypothetical protein AMELA_G00059410 [Ameiurus melas]